MHQWRLAPVRTKLDEIVLKSMTLPQYIVVDGERKLVVLSIDDYCYLANIDEHEWLGTGVQDAFQDGFDLVKAIQSYPGDPADLAELGRILDQLRSE